MYFLLKFGEYFSFKAMNVLAKFPHFVYPYVMYVYVFWKGCMKIGTAFCVGVLLTHIGFHASSQKINTFKNTRVK